MTVPPRRTPLALTVLALLHYQPLHPYGIQRLVKQSGKDQVVNVGQRASLYKVIDRLRDEGLIRARETRRDQAYPERTVYEITDAGREAAREWLVDMLAVPRQEFPEFPAALSQLMLLSAVQIGSALERRAQAVERRLAELEAALAAEAQHELPRISMLEMEYLWAVTAAESAWLRGVLADLRGGRLTSPAQGTGAAAGAGAAGRG